MPAEPSPLVGRASLLTAIGRGAREGTGAVLTGAPGSGGTRLLADAFTATRRAGLKAARLRPVASNGGRFSAFVPLLDHGAGEDLPTTDPEAIRASTVALGLQVVFLDDAHLLDEDAGSLLVDLARSGTAVIANATGPGGMPDALRRLVEEGRASAIELAPLTGDEVAELAGHLLGDPIDGELALALASASSGRPRALGEIVDAGVDARVITHVDGLWRLAGPLPVTRSLRTAVLDAFAAMPPDQRGWIAAVAQAGEVADDLAGRIAARSAIQAVAKAGWTERTATRTRLASPDIGTAVLGSLDPRARAIVLRRLITVAEATVRPLDERERVALALWRIEVGDPLDPAEARALARIPGTAPAARESLLRSAVDAGAAADAELAEHLRLTRRPAEALELIDAALPSAATEQERIELVRVRSMTTGVIERRSADALAALDQHLAAHPPHADLVAVRAAMLLLEGRPADALQAAEATLAMPDRSGFATGLALLQRSLALREHGDLDAARRDAARLTALGDVDAALVDGAALARWLPLELAVAVGAETSTAEAALVAALEQAPAERHANRRPPLSYTLASVRLLRGDPAAAVRLLQDADGGAGSWREGWQPRILAELAIASTLAGRLDDASTALDRLSRIACPPVQRGRMDLATAQLAFARGDAGLARSMATAIAERGRANGLALDAFDGAFAAIRYGVEDAPALLLELGDRPSGIGRDAQRAYARSLVESDADAVDIAAAALWDAGLRLYAIEGAIRAAALGASASQPRLVGWLARTPSLRVPGAGDRRGAGLTAREREVALLAAGGYSDRAVAAELGITLRTAQTHLGRALSKLGVHRRTELRGLIEEP